MSRALREQPRLSAKHMEVFDVSDRTGKPCEGCGATMYGFPSRLAKQRFCTWECRVAHMGPTRTTDKFPHTCRHCGVVRMIGKKRLDRPFCSVACRNAAYAINPPRPRTSVQVSCSYCGAKFSKHPSAIANGRGKFCSRRCAGLGRPLNGRPSAIATEAAAIVCDELALLAVPEMRVGRWSIDLAFPTEMIAVELDGIYWHSLPDAPARDARKSAGLSALGWQVVRVLITKDDTPATVARRAIDGITSLSRGGSDPHGRPHRQPGALLVS